MIEKPLCELCGDPMPSGEEMFKFHGYSGPCPKPPKPRPPRYLFFPGPWRFDPEGHNGGPAVLDANGSVIAALFWPSHAEADTSAATKETYALGREIALLNDQQQQVKP